MRVLLLAPDFPPGYGGIQTALARLAAQMVGAQVTVLAVATDGAAAFDGARPYRVVRVPLGPGARAGQGPGGRPVQILRHWLGPARDLVQACDVVWCGHAFAAPLAYGLGRLQRRPYVVHVYAAELAYAGWARLALGALCRRAAGCIAISSYAAGALERIGVPRARINVVPLGVDPAPAWPPIAPRVALATAGGGPVLLTVGRLVPRKGHDLVLQALPALAAIWPGLRYLVAGDGPQAERLRVLARQRGVADRVRFLGAVSATELAACYYACDVFVMPARGRAGDAEGFGLVYVEAGAYGKPAIAARAGGAAEAVLDGRTGLLVPPDDVPALAAALRRLLGDPACAVRLGVQGRERALAEFTWPQAAAGVRRVLEAACASSTTTIPVR